MLRRPALVTIVVKLFFFDVLYTWIHIEYNTRSTYLNIYSILFLILSHDFKTFKEYIRENIVQFNNNPKLLIKFALSTADILGVPFAGSIKTILDMVKDEENPATLFLEKLSELDKKLETIDMKLDKEFESIHTKLDKITQDRTKEKNFYSDNFDIHEKINEMSYIQYRDKESRRENIELRTIIKTMNKSNTIEKHYKTTLENGVLLFEQESYKKATSSFKEAVKINPDRPEAYACIGSTYGRIGDDRIALSFLLIAEKKGLSDSKVLHNIGSAYNNLNQHNDGSKYYERAIKKDPKKLDTCCALAETYNVLKRYADAEKLLSNLKHNDAEIHFWHGVSLHMQGKNSDAIISLQRALQIDGKNGKYHYTIGILFVRVRKYEDAEKHLRVSINSKFQIDDAYSELGIILCILNKECDARTNFEKAISMNSHNAATYIKKGFGLGLLSKFDEALSCFDQAEKIAPTNKKNHFCKCLTWLMKENVDMAITSFQKIKDHDPNDFESQYEFGNMLLKFSESIKSYQIFVEIINKCPKFIKAYYPTISILLKLGRISLLTKCIEDFINIEPHNIDHLNTIGDFLTTIRLHEYAIKCYDLSINENDNEYAYCWKSVSLRHIRNYDESIRCLKTAMKKYPNSMLLNEAMAEVLLYSGDGVRAFPFINLILKSHPTNAGWRYNYGVLLEQRGSYKNAMENFSLAVKYNPNHDKAYYNLGVLYHRKKMDEQAKICFQMSELIKKNQVDQQHQE